MSAVRAVRVGRPQPVNTGLRLLPAASPAVNRAVTVFGLGLIATVLAGLVLNVFIAQSAYEMAHLKHQSDEINLSAQVLGEEVGSLSSNQNLEQAAHDMGMVANSNPVFLDLATQRVFGRPRAANQLSALSSNLVANSSLSSKTNVSAIQAADAARAQARAAAQSAAGTSIPKTSQNVAKVKKGTKPVSLLSSGIPGSPTN